ncbi:MAG TPA: hypothetical protein VLA49_14375 [Anaerolineales bacterium]|nr:hypothetical protein [Anaerolineales bacterium]
MLTHSERTQLAHSLCERMVRQYPDEILVGGVYGSTSRGTDTPWSDLEMWFVVSDGCPAQEQHLLYRDTAVGYRVYQRSELENILTTPSTRWPFHMGVLSELQVLHGDPARVQAWIEMGKAIPRPKFLAALKAILPDLVVESHGRIHSSLIRQEKHTLFPHVFEVLFEMLTALCLLNQRWVRHDYFQGLEQSFEFPKLPAGYQEIVPILYEARDPNQTLVLADRLVASYWDLLIQEGIRVRNYQNLAELPL